MRDLQYIFSTLISPSAKLNCGDVKQVQHWHSIGAESMMLSQHNNIMLLLLLCYLMSSDVG